MALTIHAPHRAIRDLAPQLDQDQGGIGAADVLDMGADISSATGGVARRQVCGTRPKNENMQRFTIGGVASRIRPALGVRNLAASWVAPESPAGQCRDKEDRSSWHSPAPFLHELPELVHVVSI
jgi:hypothetical protein